MSAAAISMVLPVKAETLCTLVTDATTGRIVYETGNCDSRVTPASTFKIPLAVMGFDSGFLIDPATPALPFAQGYPDWTAAWRQDTDPSRWMRESVVWYSQQIAKSIGIEGLVRYAHAFKYGNADFSGDPGQDNALERAWISSSLKISPREQVSFLRSLLLRQLPASAEATDNTLRIVESHAAGAWTLWGKTGSAYPRRADGNFDRQHGWGWYVGWAARGNQLFVFARLTQNDGSGTGPDGLRTRAQFFQDWPEMLHAIP